MFKRIINNQSGISLVEVMVAAGISSVIALSTMKISTNAQKASRKVTIDADVSSFFNITLRGRLSSDGACKAELGPGLNGLSIGGKSAIPSIFSGEDMIAVDSPLPGFEREFNVTSIEVERRTDSTCRLWIDMTRINADGGKKLGAKDRRRFIDISCGYTDDPSANTLAFCSSTEAADGGNSPWERKLDSSNDNWVEFNASNFPSAVIGQGSGSPPRSKLTISNAVDTQAFKGGSDGIGLLFNDGIKWSEDPLRMAEGVGILGDVDCIRIFSETGTESVTIAACATSINMYVPTTITGTLNVSGTITSDDTLNGTGLNVGTGVIQGGSVNVGGQVSSGSVSTGAVTATSVSAGTGTISGGLISSTGDVTAAGAIKAGPAGEGSIDANGDISGRNLTLTGNANISGSLSAAATTVASLNSAGEVVASGGLKTNTIGAEIGSTITIGSVLTSTSAVTVGNTIYSSYFSTSGGVNTPQIHVSGIGTFGGNVSMAADLSVAGTFSNSSDRRLKRDIKTTDLGLEFINSLKPVRYVYKADKSDNPVYRIGLIAQDLEESINKHSDDLKDKNYEILRKNEKGFFSVAYQSLISPLINAVKELFSQVNSNKAEIAQLKAENEMLKSALCSKHDNEFKFCDSRGLASEKK